MIPHKGFFKSIMAVLLIFSLLSALHIESVYAAKTAEELQQEIDDLQAKSDAIAEEREALEQEIEANRNKTLTIVEQKSQVDREIELARREIENANDQIHHYNMLIAEKQAELDILMAEQHTQLSAYQKRMRAMQERGTISYFEVMLQAKSFSDMLNCRVMLEEVARADQRMLDEIRDIAAEVLRAKDALAAEKVAIELKKVELAEAEALLAEKRAESDTLLVTLYADREKLIEECEKYEKEEAVLTDQIAALEAERTDILYQEWLASQPQGGSSGSNSSSGNSSGNNAGSESNPPATSQRFYFPMAYCTMLTSAYGYRVHPITGNYAFHSGVDLAAGVGTEIYATKSGTVTTATENYVYGNYVIINHLDGYSSLYGHMTHYTVSEGQYVHQGQVIGYVGLTGWTNGPHLHFTLYYNGSTVNPMNYISIP